MHREDIETFRRRVDDELHGNIIPFWLTRAVDDEHGGFIGRMANDLTVDATAPRGLILYARLLWTFAALSRFEADGRYPELARRAYDYLDEYFWDDGFGGAFWRVDHRGRLLDDKKKVYGQAFYVYALAEYYLATEDAAASTRAQQMFELIEQHSHDSAYGGYFETCNRDWTLAEDARLSDKDMNEKKSMNNHLHLLESYTNLYRIWRDPRVETRLAELIDVFGRHIVEPGTVHFGHFFDETWQRRSDTYTFGHDIEGSWLLCEAADALGRPERATYVKDLALRIAEAVLAEGLDDDGGLFYEGKDGRVIDTDKEWWPQAEAVVGFLNAHRLSGRWRFFEAARDCWEFIERHIVDREHGEWFWRVSRDGRPDPQEPKVSEWKSPYHNVRACLATMRRLATLSEGD